jgi:hypothetical protein
MVIRLREMCHGRHLRVRCEQAADTSALPPQLGPLSHISPFRMPLPSSRWDSWLMTIASAHPKRLRYIHPWRTEPPADIVREVHSSGEPRGFQLGGMRNREVGCLEPKEQCKPKPMAPYNAT